MTAVDSLEPTVLGAGWRHRRVVGIWILAGLVLCGAYLVLTPTRYQGTASIVLQQGVVPGTNTNITPERFVADQVALLRSPVVAARAATILAKGDGTVVPKNGSRLGTVSVSSSATDSEVKISVGASTSAAADAAVRALLDAFGQVQNETAATNGALQQVDTAIAGIDTQLAKLNPTGAANPDPRVAGQVTQLLTQRTALQQQRDQINVNNSLSAGRFIVSSQPKAARRSIRGTAVKLAVVAIALGLLIGIGHAYTIGLRRKRFDSKLQPQSLLRAPLLIDVPALDRKSPSDQLVVRDAPASLGAEAFLFAAQMQFGNDTGTPGRGVVIALTSAESGTGTTTVVANLGLALAQSGLLVLLIDGAATSDGGAGRRGAQPSLTELFVGPGGAFLGLLDVTEKGVALADAAGTVGDRRLVLLGGGNGHNAANGNAGGAAEDEPLAGMKIANGATSEFSGATPRSGIETSSRGATSPTITEASVESASFGAFAVDRLLVEARDLFDFVLIDAPPVLRIGARGVLLQSADQVVMVVAEGEPVDPVQDATSRVHALSATVAGYVYNRLPNRVRSRSRRRSAR